MTFRFVLFCGNEATENRRAGFVACCCCVCVWAVFNEGARVRVCGDCIVCACVGGHLNVDCVFAVVLEGVFASFDGLSPRNSCIVKGATHTHTNNHETQ